MELGLVITTNEYIYRKPLAFLCFDELNIMMLSLPALVVNGHIIVVKTVENTYHL